LLVTAQLTSDKLQAIHATTSSKMRRPGRLDAAYTVRPIPEHSPPAVFHLPNPHEKRTEGDGANLLSLGTFEGQVCCFPGVARFSPGIRANGPRNVSRLGRCQTRRSSDCQIGHHGTDQSGRFSLQGITHGDYRFYAWEAIEGGAVYGRAHLLAFPFNLILISFVEVSPMFV